MINCYERSLFEQQTPYLQWLKERECRKKVVSDDIKGKRMVKLPFFSCEESLKACMERAGFDGWQDAEFIIFHGAYGSVDETAECYFSDYFTEHADVAIVYADEDYLGSLQEIYGDKVIESEYAREYCFHDTGLYRGFPWFKPDYSPDTLRAFFYFGNIFAVRGAALKELLAAGKTADLDTKPLSIYEMVLELTDRTAYAGHISEVLFTNEVKMQDMQLDKNFARCPEVKNEIQVASVHTKEEKQALCQLNRENNLITIVIPSKDNSQILKRCLSTLVELTDYPHYEIVIVDNGSSEQEQLCIRQCISEVEEDYDLKWADDDNPVSPLSIQYIYQKADFNFSTMCNLGAKAAKGDYLLFLNDDIEIMESSWLRRMLEQATLEHVGAVGAKLYYPKEDKDKYYRIQHVGITNMGIGPAHKLAGMEDKGNLYHGHNLVIYNMLAVTAACLMVSRERFWEVEGFDEELAVAYNDVELCFKLYEKGYYNVQRNDVILLHHESLSRGQDTGAEKAARLEREKILLYQKHPLFIAKDPFYSEHLVQWKKDVEYSCNYLYPFDKQVEPELLEQKAVAKLPKEHQNKYIRKLTGESLSMFEIDQAEVSETDGTLCVQGWYVMREHDNAMMKRTLLLENVDCGEIYECVVYSKLRYDVADLFQAETGNPKRFTRNVALSGLQVLIDKNTLSKGNYRIGVLTVEEKSLMARKICWKKDCLFTVQ